MRASSLLVLAALLAPSLAGASPLPDPTRPADAPIARANGGTAAAGPVLQSTLVSPTRRVAVIDGRTVGVGDKVHGATVVDIQPYEVRIHQNGRDARLRMLPRLAKEKGTVE